MEAKYRRLRDRLRGLASCLVAFSGGVDSAFLAKVARDVLGDRALAVTACSESYPAWERDEALALAAEIGIRHRCIVTRELRSEAFAANPPDRCYHCKRELFAVLREIAAAEGIAWIADGTDADDIGDHRPGRRAAAEAGVISPLLEVGLGKTEIRALSRQLGLPTWDKPSYACLASRFPYGERITADKLRQVEEAENILRRLGIRQARVRHHGAVARIEVEASDIPLLAGAHRQTVVAELRSLGFSYVALDLQGYRTGSMNEILPTK